MNQILKTSTTLVLATFALAACGTPGPVRDLASRTAANVSQVSTHLNRHSPDDIQIRENRTTVPPPREPHPFGSHPMA